MMVPDFNRAIAAQILKAIDGGDTSRAAIMAYVRRQLPALAVTDQDIEEAARGLIALQDLRDSYPAVFERRAS